MEIILGYCQTCARPFSDRAAWRARGASAEVRYCSAGCRRSKPTQRDHTLEQWVLSTLRRTQTQVELQALECQLDLQGEREKKRLERAVKRLALSGALTLRREGRVITEPGNARRPFSISLASI